jgi:simple sugar transport system ATP-binding protein
MKVLAGANPDYTGEVYLNDRVVDLRTTMAAKKLGIQIVYQEVDTALIPTLSVAENVMLNETVMNTRGRPMMHWNKLRRDAGRCFRASTST